MWDLSDTYLQSMLQLWIDNFIGPTCTLRLAQNDFTVAPGMGLGDLTEADFPGYFGGNLNTNFFGGVTVVSHVAQSTYGAPIDFTADSSGFSSQTLFGYYVTDVSGNYFMCEKFPSPITIFPSGVISVTPRLKHKTCSE